jgi:hypothetical protein
MHLVKDARMCTPGPDLVQFVLEGLDRAAHLLLGILLDLGNAHRPVLLMSLLE